MHADLVMGQIRDVAAMVGELLDADVEVVSIHIGPVNLPPTVRVMPCDYTRRLASASTLCALSGEMRVRLERIELAWEAPDQPMLSWDEIARAVRSAA